MQVQSLSIDVPAPCLNNCEFCVAHMHRNDYVNQIEFNHRFRRLYKEDYKKRLMFARDNGCNVLMFTGNGEPLLNRHFLEDVGEWNSSLPQPFRWMEIQTSGTKLNDEYLRFLRDSIGISTISLSISSLDDEVNAKYNRTKEGFKVYIKYLCKEIKRYDFNLRLSLNLTDWFNDYLPLEIFHMCKQLGADQVTLRVLYLSNNQSPEDNWIMEHRHKYSNYTKLKTYIKEYGKPLEKLPFGAIKYSVNGMSVVIDEDCMATQTTDVMKYLILRPNGKLYSKWDDKGSLVF